MTGRFGKAGFQLITPDESATTAGARQVLLEGREFIPIPASDAFEELDKLVAALLCTDEELV